MENDYDKHTCALIANYITLFSGRFFQENRNTQITVFKLGQMISAFSEPALEFMLETWLLVRSEHLQQLNYMGITAINKIGLGRQEWG